MASLFVHAVLVGAGLAAGRPGLVVAVGGSADSTALGYAQAAIRW